MGNFSRNAFGCLLGIGLAANACSGGDDDAPPPADVSGPEGAGNTTGAGTGGTPLLPEVDNCNGEGAPVVELTIEEGIGDGVHTGTLTAKCTVTTSSDEGALQYDAESIQLIVEDEDADEDMPIVIMEPGTPTEEDDEFEATFSLNTLASKSHTVTCFATDTGVEELTCGTAKEEVLVDTGPNIEIRQPQADESLSASTVQNFEFVLTPAELTGDDGDELAGEFIVSIHGQDFPLVPKEGSPDVYWVDGGVELDEEAYFPDELPEGPTQVTVRAANARGVERSFTYNIVVDGEGPNVDFVFPDDLSIVGREVIMRMEITDDYSDVDWDTLVVSSSGVDKPFDLDSGQWSRVENEVVFTFLVSEFDVLKTLVLNVSVEDTAENGNGLDEVTFRVDEWGPLISFDPPLVREWNKDGNCSVPYAPLGTWVTRPGEDVEETGRFRALVWDRTNTRGEGVSYFSGIEGGSTRLWVAPGDEPLVEDADGDGYCDSLNDDAGAQLKNLDPVTPVGRPVYDTEWDDLVPADPLTKDVRICEGGALAGEFCTNDGQCGTGTCAEEASVLACGRLQSPLTPPGPICDSDLTVAVHRNSTDNTVPAVYGTDVTPVSCTGDGLELGSLLPANYEGWVCVAATGEDQVGNVGVSEPLAICFDRDTTDPSHPSCWGQEPPEGMCRKPVSGGSDPCLPVKFGEMELNEGLGINAEVEAGSSNLTTEGIIVRRY